MNFVANCMCEGRKPRQLADTAYFHRNVLLTRMMQDRHLVRYVVAPPLFGKTRLAGSYAELLFDFKNTYWINAQSPCFLREIDVEALVDKLLDNAREPSLVVFEDIPMLNEVRSDEFWRTCSLLLSKDWEVIVTATPSSDPLGHRGEACIVLTPVDLLFDDADFENLRLMDIDAQRLHPPRFLCDRVPGLARRTPGSYERFLSAQISDMPIAADVALLFCTLALERGTFDDLAHALGRPIDGEQMDMEAAHPYVHVDSFRHEFDAAGFPLREVIRAFTPYMQRIAESTGASEASVLIARIADVLANRGAGERAAELLIALCAPSQRAAWLEANQADLSQTGTLAALQIIYESLHPGREGKRASLAFGNAARLCLLGREDAGAKQLERIVRRGDLPLNDRLRAMMGLLLFADDAFCADKAFEGMRISLQRELECNAGIDGCKGDALRLLWRAIGASGDEGLSAVMTAVPDADAAAAALACFIRGTALWTCRNLSSGKAMAFRDVLAKIAVSVFVQCGDGESACLGEVLLKRELERFDELDAALPVALHRSVWRRCEAFDASLEAQRARYDRACDDAAAKMPGRSSRAAATLVDAAAGGSPLRTVMQVSMFGGFDVKIGERQVERSLLSRQKVRTLLALLVLNGGKDLSCGSLCNMLWPESNADKARHNFYSIWSLLHKAVSLPNGDCPYLVRSQGVCRIDAQLVRSDASDIAELCRKMVYEKSDSAVFQSLFDQVTSTYRGDLLPGEDRAQVINSARIEWRNRLTEAMLVAATTLKASGRKPLALQYAQQALTFDAQREDAYRAVIELQMSLGLRPAAIETWRAYCAMCKTELGLDPSPDMVRFYRDIIKTSPDSATDSADFTEMEMPSDAE